MFFSSKKKAPKKDVPRSSKRKNETDDFLLPFGINPSNNEDDSALEAELFALGGGPSFSHKNIAQDVDADDDESIEAELAALVGKTQKKHSLLPQQVFTNIEITDKDDDDADDDVDENDPELLGELSKLTCDDDRNEINKEEESPIIDDSPTDSLEEILKKRLDMYKVAENAAKTNNDASRARRLNRGIKTLEKLLKQAQNGGLVPPDEIPPEIVVNVKKNEERVEERPEVIDNSIKVEKTIDDILQERLAMYNKALDKAKEGNESSKIRRFSRGIKTLEDLLKKRTAGEVVSVEEIPPEVALNLKPPSENTEPNINQELVELLTTRREAYKTLALSLKRSNQLEEALVHVKTVKVFDSLLEKARNGIEISAEEIPPALSSESPTENQSSDTETPESILKHLQARRDEYKAIALSLKKLNKVPEALEYVKTIKKLDALIVNAQKGPINIEEIPEKPKNLMVDSLVGSCDIEVAEEAFPQPVTVAEALNERLEYFQKSFEVAVSSGNRSEARKLKEAVTLYTGAIRAYNRKSLVNWSRLPDPPGFPPLQQFLKS